jgi:Nucleotidyl transferase AbiEii toxin, Type IV TA system
LATLIQFLLSLSSSIQANLPNETRRIVLKEALQVLYLDYLYNHDKYRALNFYGGSCLRVIFGLNRLSEDLYLDNGGSSEEETASDRSVDLSHLPDDLLAYTHQILGYHEASVKTQEGASGIFRITLKFPILQELGLTSRKKEAFHLKLEISGHHQVVFLQRTPIISFGRSFLPSHFSLETMMAAKMLACLERSFERGSKSTKIKGRDFYDLLWFMQQHIQPLEEKLAREGKKAYTTKTAMVSLSEKIQQIQPRDLELDLLPLFEQRNFIVIWIEDFHRNFRKWVNFYL